jgi:hypothetical protein
MPDIIPALSPSQLAAREAAAESAAAAAQKSKL